MKSLHPLLTALLLGTLLSACGSTGGSTGDDAASTGTSDDLTQVVPHTGQDCNCGTPAADRVGCHCEDCLLRGGNPDNPDCTCLPLAPRRRTLDGTTVSFGDGGGSGGLVGFDTLVLKREGRVTGTVVDDDGEHVVFDHAGGSQVTYSYDDLNTRSLYKLLKAKTERTDGAAELRLATYARDIGLYAHGKRHYGFALEADPSLEEEVHAGLARLDELASDSELAQARDAFEAGKEKEAHEHLENVVTEYPDQPAARGARALLEDLDGQRKARLGEEASQRHSADVAEAIEPAEKRLAKARDYNQDGLVAKSQASSIRAYEHAILEGDRCKREVDRARKSARSDEGVLMALSKIEGDRDELAGDVNLNLASVYFTRTDYREAMKSTNAALAIDQNDKDALAMRARIETAANDWRSDDDVNVGYLYGYRAGTVRRARLGVGRRVGYGGGVRMGGGMRLR